MVKTRGDHMGIASRSDPSTPIVSLGLTSSALEKAGSHSAVKRHTTKAALVLHAQPAETLTLSEGRTVTVPLLSRADTATIWLGERLAYQQ